MASCVSTTELQPETASYQKDLVIREAATIIVGMVVLPNKLSYDLKFDARENPEIVRISNCHRDVIFRYQKKHFSFRYTPNRRIENGSCALLVTFLDDKGRHQFGAISFRDDETLPATVSCNGTNVKYDGASVCQAKSGTIQAIDFDVPVQVRSMACTVPTGTDDRKHWTFATKDDFCLYVFKSDNGEVHKLTTFGYNEIMKQ